MTRFTVFNFILILAVSTSARAESADEDDFRFPTFKISVYASGLEQPDGLAIHPKTGDLYVSEETAGRVSVIRQGQPHPVIRSGFTVTADPFEDAGDAEEVMPREQARELRSPEGIAFGPDGRLYVVEDSPFGRVLAFEEDAAGQFQHARALAMPQLAEPYAWESICFARDGQLFLAGSSYEAERTWGYSCVLTRDASHDWWMVDFGPLASFSALTMAPDEHIMVVGDESVGSLTWWDVERKRELQTFTERLGVIEGLCQLPDGSLAVAIESSTEGGRVLRVDPASGEITTLAKDLGTLESIVFDQQTGRLFVSEDSSGRILCLTPSRPIEPSVLLMQTARRSSEARRGLPPRETPPFLKQFMSKVGVDLVDSVPGLPYPTSAESDKLDPNQPITLEQLGSMIPLVAGRLKVEELHDDPDPVTEVSFMNLFPNQITQVGSQPTPSVCLFAARHRSGKVSRSSAVGGIRAYKRSAAGSWESLANDAMMMLPLTTCSAVENKNGVTVVLSFVGIDKFGDCFLTLNYGRSNSAYFATSSDKLRVARATFTERKPDGRTVQNFAMTGVRARRVDDATWMKMGPSSQWTLLSPGLDSWIPRRAMATMPELVSKLRHYNHYVVDALLADMPDDAPADISQKEQPPSKKPADPRSVEKKPAPALPPVADLKIAPPDDEEKNSFTNILLSRIARAWDQVW